MKLSIVAASVVAAGTLALAPGSASANYHQQVPVACPPPAPVCRPVCRPACPPPQPVCQVSYCDPCRRSGLLGLGILGIL